MDANIIKTLEKALTDVDAPIGEHWGCGFLTTQNIKDTLDLLKQRETEVDILTRKNETLKDEISELKEELFFAKQKRANIFELVESYGRGQIAGYKEFAEKLKKKVETETYDDVDPSGKILRYEYYIVYVEDIDETLVELTEK